jgi:hypothetical protein
VQDDPKKWAAKNAKDRCKCVIEYGPWYAQIEDRCETNSRKRLR